jgi:hypothetical protein
MLTMYFCCEGREPVIRCWSAVPRIGETVVLAEMQEEGESFKVIDVVWEGDGEPTISIHLKPAEGLIRRILKSASTPTPCNSGNGS